MFLRLSISMLKTPTGWLPRPVRRGSSERRFHTPVSGSSCATRCASALAASGGLDRCHVEHRSVQHSASVLNAQASAVAHPPHAAVGAHDSILDVQTTGLVRAVVRLVKHIHIQGGGR